MLPDFVVIGAQKSASTFLQLCLSDHPDVYMPKGELAAFETPDYEAGGLAALEPLFEGRHESRQGFKRPNYLGRPEGPQRLDRDLPGVQLIVVLRDPVERAVSAYFHYMRGGFLPVRDIEPGMRAILEDPELHRRHPRAQEVIDFGRYADCLARYQQFIDSGRLLIMMHERVSREPVASLAEAYTFLGVDPDVVPASLSARPQRIPYNLPRLRLGRLSNALTTTRSADGMRAHPRQLSAPRYVAAGALRVADRVLEPMLDNAKPVLSDDLRRRLAAVYEPQVERLRDDLGLPVDAWLRA